MATADATIAARRRHILWLIEHHPESEVLTLSEATLDPSGHRLADADGYRQARTLWLAQTDRSKNPTVLANAARFFQLHDKPLAVDCLKRAVALAPDTPAFAGQLGYVYALSAMGVTMLTSNGLPTAAFCFNTARCCEPWRRSRPIRMN